MRKREPYGNIAQDKNSVGHTRAVVCGGEKAGKANEVRWQSALHDPDFLLPGKGDHPKSMVGLVFKMVL